MDDVPMIDDARLDEITRPKGAKHFWVTFLLLVLCLGAAFYIYDTQLFTSVTTTTFLSTTTSTSTTTTSTTTSTQLQIINVTYSLSEYTRSPENYKGSIQTIIGFLEQRRENGRITYYAIGDDDTDVELKHSVWEFMQDDFRSFFSEERSIELYKVVGEMDSVFRKPTMKVHNFTTFTREVRYE